MQVVETLTSLSSYVNNGCCTLRRMLIVVASFVGLSILTLLIQYYLTRNGSTTIPYSSFKYSGVTLAATETDPNISSEFCWLHESYEIIAECVPCTEFERAAGIKPCKPSGHYDKINCTNAGVVYRKCQRVPRVEERNFILFLVLSTVCALTFSFLAHLRQKVLDRKMMQKLQRQLGDEM